MSSVVFVLTLLLSLVSATLPEAYQQHLQGDPSVTHLVKFEVSQKNNPLGTLSIALFGETVPKTVENFVWLSEQDDGYVNTPFHRVIPNFMVQGGATAGGKSKYGGRFDDENFALKHDKLGRLSCANAGKNTNLDQFFILNTDQTPWLDGKHVVFGQMVDGFDVLMNISNSPQVDTKLNDEVKITKVEVVRLENSTNTNKVISNQGKIDPTPKNPERSNLPIFILILALIALAIWGGLMYRESYNNDVQHPVKYN
ncbi:hypothetical protein DIURU_004990 [Diutina rugosa]|uniref:Peptidyl-prolyl cis-trans isomerase n=1 Tax=Diutina rugosa TaxID=5481 RepID=A0A642UMM9_DIURU|nr:uncharacterized protein DIURU_004990 [Diutina rugosa]KAA8898135.1 hypothetical protein DIURU_004990 [Diutina rugosa]